MSVNGIATRNGAKCPLKRDVSISEVWISARDR